MPHLRMPASMIEARAGYHNNVSADRQYLFTLIRWHAMAYLSPDSGVLTEVGEEDPNTLFPRHVMRSVDYGISRGMSAYVMQYALVGNPQPVGAIMALYFGDKELGNYAVRLGMNSTQGFRHFLNPRKLKP